MERFTTRPELRGTFGMVASTHWLASAAGMAMLERGGNAFDAAVAAGFVLQVVEPHLNGPGGEVPILLYSAERDEVLVVDGQGTAPAAATIERFRELGHELVPGTGLLAACVPGAFDAWLLLLREFGTLPLADVLEPAIGYAESGYPLVPGIVRSIERMEQVFRDEWPASAELYLPVPRAGELFRNRDLAATYRRVLAESNGELEAAREVFYRGFVAEAIAGAGSLLDGDDLASWQASIEQPVSRTYHGWEVFKTGPWGQGPVFLQQLALLDGFDLGDRESPELRPHGRRVREARLRRPRGLVRRRRGPAGRPAQPGLRGRTARPRRRGSLGRAAPWQPRRARAAPSAHPGRRSQSPAPASRPAATPVTSTWSTASATRSRRPRAAAGCTARP